MENLLQYNSWYDINDSDLTLSEISYWEDLQLIKHELSDIFENIKRQILQFENCGINYYLHLLKIKINLPEELLETYYDNIRKILDIFTNYFNIPNYENIKDLNVEVEKIFDIMYETFFIEILHDMCYYLLQNNFMEFYESGKINRAKKVIEKYLKTKIEAFTRIITILKNDENIKKMESKLTKYIYVLEVIGNSGDSAIEYIYNYLNTTF